MHFEVPKASTFKEFGGEYLMIVISILTALALEHGAQAIHHRTVAHQASERIDAEIRANIDDIDKARAHNKTERDKVEKMRTVFLADIKGGATDEVLRKRLYTDYKGQFSLSVRTPTLRREAWEVAVANQAVSWMSSDDLKRYSVIYAQMRELQTIAASGGNNFMDGPRWLDAMSNMQMGSADPRELYRMMNQMLSAYEGINDNLKGLQDEMENATVKQTAAH